jgi:ribosomal protein S18 acetylase RimI-like enzyme
MPGFAVRPYEARDRAAVHRICFETGYMGEPIDWQWRDGASFADLICAYYTDHEPESALVGERDGRVVGYLLGCVATERVVISRALVTHHMLRRGVAFRPGTAGFIWRAAADVAVAMARRTMVAPTVDDPRWPAHLHIDLLPEARGQGLGANLIRRWLDSLRERSVPGCHLETMSENTDAIAFFRSMGFEPHGPQHPLPGMRLRGGGRVHHQLMAQSL